MPPPSEFIDSAIRLFRKHGYHDLADNTEENRAEAEQFMAGLLGMY